MRNLVKSLPLPLRLGSAARRGAKALALMLVVCALAPDAARAQLDAIRSEFSAALRDAQATQKSGPAIVPLLDEATLQIPADYVFVPMPAAARLLKAMGNRVDPHLVGVVFPGHDENWLMVVQFEKTGFIREDDARQWNVDDLLRSVREGTERGNELRREQGLPEIEITGWVEKPRYDTGNHRLVWAVAAHDSGSNEKDTAQGVNYNTYMLGRDGYFKFNLVTDLKDLSGQQAAADEVTASLHYLDGKRYQDFDPASDPVADFSIAALVAGIAVKKLGFPAVLAAVVAKFSIAIGAAAVLVLAGLLTYLAVRRRARKRRLADDFPATEIHGASLDEPTLALFDAPDTVVQSLADESDDSGPPTITQSFVPEVAAQPVPAADVAPTQKVMAVAPPASVAATENAEASQNDAPAPEATGASTVDAAADVAPEEHAPEEPPEPELPVPMLPLPLPPLRKIHIEEQITEPPMSEPPIQVLPIKLASKITPNKNN